MWADEHDWKNYPELTNSQLAEFGFMSPHEQITEGFWAEVVRVHDGDTFLLRCDFRDFGFSVRLVSVDCPELNTGVPGEEARDFCAGLCLGELVFVRVDRRNRVDKYGRLLGDVIVGGMSVSEMLMMFGLAWPFGRRREGELPDLNKDLGVRRWF